MAAAAAPIEPPAPIPDVPGQLTFVYIEIEGTPQQLRRELKRVVQVKTMPARKGAQKP